MSRPQDYTEAARRIELAAELAAVELAKDTLSRYIVAHGLLLRAADEVRARALALAAEEEKGGQP